MIKRENWERRSVGSDTGEITVVGSVWTQSAYTKEASWPQRNHLFYNTWTLRRQDKLLTVQLRSGRVMSADSHCTKATAKRVHRWQKGYPDVQSDPISAVIDTKVWHKYIIMIVWTLLQTLSTRRCGDSLQHPYMPQIFIGLWDLQAQKALKNNLFLRQHDCLIM